MSVVRGAAMEGAWPHPAPMEPTTAADGPQVSEVNSFRRQVDDLLSKTDVLEKRVNEVVGFYNSKKHSSGGRKAGGRYAANGARDSHGNGMPDLMRQFAGIIRQITSHEWAQPFLQPVDVVGLQLDDYHQIITKPMDFSTIRNKMEGKESTTYNSVREIYSDVRLVFTNAMKYNVEGHPVNIMAKFLLERFEEKWLHLLPKVENEEREREEPNDAPTISISPEAAIAKLAEDTGNELNEINKQLEELQKMVVQRCRKMTTDEKRKLGAGLCQLSPEDLNKALELVAQDNPSFQTTAEEVDLDMDAQSETTLWRLKFFVREALEQQANVDIKACGKTDENTKRSRDMYNALAKTVSKRVKR
ncbi:transcription factor GTE1 [Aegilops tauschii subsp. strangulata]|uniref:Bromo domain-containing protein n=1 Tax=Aegilops tauschii subsp. strangulata TaxID=200361 RepID=A0A452ZR18_AEGTS|nr:transcription factor GTE1 [Aegilops tauschii subsp. strangulata]XP_020158370.1 transcription factor GTE1 [Aegilops tauschii subsp. strangulata]